MDAVNKGHDAQQPTAVRWLRLFGAGLLFLLLLGTAFSTQAATVLCSDFADGVVDGFNPADHARMDTATTFGIDRDCTIKNYPQTDPLDLTLINFNFPNQASYLIVFDNVYYNGGMSCNDPTQSDFWMWWVNGSYNTISSRCQDFLLPVDSIVKENPAGTTTAVVGVPFTYTLTMPVLVELTALGYEETGLPETEPLGKWVIRDDLTASGADLTYVSNNAYLLHPDNSTTPLGSLNVTTADNKHLEFSYANNPLLPVIQAGDKLVIELTVVLDNSTTNTPGTQFINTAEWEFAKAIDLNGDGSIDPATEVFDPLPGQSGVTNPMTIVGPDLVVNKTGSETALNLGVLADFTIDVQNVGGADAWNVTIVDQLPDQPPGAGMCPDSAPAINARIFAADGVTPVSDILVAGVDYTLNYTNDTGTPACQLSLTMTSATAVIGPSEHLIISYQAQLDEDTVTDGVALTNIAGATQWFSAAPGGSYPVGTYTRTLTDGTPGTLDHQDSFTVTTALSGYYFQKTVVNTTTGEDPAITAAPGDRLRYRVRIFNFTEVINDVRVSDTLNPALFNLASFTMVAPPAAGATYTWDSDTGLLQVIGNPPPLDLTPPTELVFEFEIDVAAGLANGTLVPNQANFTANAGTLTAASDDPYVNGIAAPGDPADPTTVVIQAAGGLTKANPAQTTATIGDQFTYTITVPASPVDIPLYDVRILDDLSASSADIGFVSASVVSGGSWVLSNTGTPTSLVLEDTSTGIDIPANEQAVIQVTVELLNTTTNQAGLTFSNAASYTYNRANGDSGTQTPGGSGSSGDMTVVEPHITTITKTANNPTPTAGDVVRYTVTLTASGDADNSDVFDVTLTDTLGLGLVYEGNSAVTVGAGVSADNFINDPVITGDGIATPQTLVWSLSNGSDIDIAEGTSITISYDVRVLNSVLDNQVLTNSVVAEWTSLDGASNAERNGSDGIGGLNDYITAPATLTFTTPPDALDKQNTQTNAGIGIPFTYRVVVPATPQSSALNDVRILDDLTASAADLSFVSVTRVSGSQPWTPVNTGTSTNLVIEDTTNGIDIPAGEQITIDITVVLNNSPTNVLGLAFTNTANYTFNQVDNNPATQNPGLPDTTDPMTIGEPNELILNKSGPASMRIGIPGTYTLNVYNTSTDAAYDATITDIIPNPDPGGMCDVQPSNITAQIYQADGVTPVGALLAENNDFTVNFIPGTPTCTLTFTMVTPEAAIPGNHRLIISYQATLDTDSESNTPLTNIAGVTEWFSGDTAGTGATGEIRTYRRTITDGTVGIPDHEDAFTVVTEAPIIQFQKSVINVTTGQNPGANASPGDTLRYQIVATNVSPLVASGFSIIDVIDNLNSPAVFEPGTLTIITVPTGADTSNTDPNGGTNGTGLLDVRNLNLDAQGGANDTIVIEFEVTLASVISSGTLVLNQANLQVNNLVSVPSDDPNVNGNDDPNLIGDEDPTQTLIASAPLFQVNKISEDISGSSTELLPGDTLRYTITVKNIGTENAVNAMLQDQIPSNTTYVPGTTTLNGVTVPDPSAGVSAIESGMLINAPEDTTTGYMRADVDATTDNVATITFDVIINAGVIEGTIISNQGYVNGDGAGSSGSIAQQPSDDPDTSVPNDPTRDILGYLPLVDVLKTVALVPEFDNGTPGIVDPGDVLRYTITATNSGAVAASGVTLTDAIPANTTYRENTVYLNGMQVPDNGGVSPLVAGIPISSSDQTPPLPAVGNLSPGESAVVIFDVLVNAATPSGTIISNQGFVASNEQPLEPTDQDGLDSNGDQPTLIVVGDAQQLAITKEVLVVDGGPATAGGQLEYVVRVTNVGTVPVIDVVIHDNLDDPVAGQMTFVDGSATLNGLPTGVTYLAPLLVADYGNTYGVLQPGQVVELRFRVLLDAGLAISETVTNTALAYWNAMSQNASAEVSIDIGALQGVANLNGRIWHDANFNDTFDSGERPLADWLVEVYFRGNLLTSVSTDANGEYQVTGLASNYVSSTDHYELRFVAPGAGANTAKLGEATSDEFSNGLQHIDDIVVYPGDNLQNLNLPIDPDGVIYNSVVRTPVAGATVTMLRAATNTPLPASCFDDPAQQNQVTLADGFYKFDINFSQPECTSGSDYIISVTPPASGYVSGESVIIPPVTNAAIAPFSVPACLGSTDDAVPATTSYCEVQTFTTAPPLAIAARTNGTNYHLHLTLDNGQIPGESQLFNNHIPLDPVLAQAVTIHKTTPMVNVTRGTLVPYSIVVNNTLSVPLTDVAIIDNMPAGFKYVAGSARVNGVKTEPVADGLQLSWDLASIEVDAEYKIDLLLIVGAGVQEGEYVNRAHVVSNVTGSNISGESSATVRVVPDPTFDCSDIIGKVFDDRNHNGYQDEGEDGIPGVRLATARGLLVTTDKYGRFHVTCAMVPDEQRGSNFILKLDERSLPSGYRVTTENPRVQRLTRGKMVRFNFGATVHHVVSLSVADGVFQSDSTQIRPQWLPRLDLLIDELRKQPSILRMTYLADVESAGLVDDRLAELKERILKRWKEVSSDELSIETEVFWRHGGPVENNSELSGSHNLLGFASGAFDQGNFGEDTEKQLPYGYTFTPWMQDPDLFKVESPEIKTEQVTQKNYTTRKLTNVVPPIRFDSGEAEIPDEFVNKLRNVLDSMRDRVNVRLHFIGHTDNVQLSDELQRRYVDNLGLSRERAGTTAEFFQRALGLPPEAISYEGMGESKPIASNYTESGKARNRRVEVEVWYDEVSDELVDQTVEVDQEIKRIMVCRVETMCKLSYKQGHSRRTKLKNLVPPFHYDEGISEIPAQYLQQLRQALQNLKGKENVQMRFIGYTDNIPLGERDARIYGDHTGLSKANARRVATAVQEALGLRNIAVASTGKGSGYPLASNNSEKGRALNRRIEVEFWHDDPLEDLPDEPQICPESAAAETVERIYNPPEGDIQPIYFENGQPVIPEGYTKHLQRAMADLSDKGNVRLRFVGYTSNKRLDRRTAMVYGDDIGLSTARARRAMEAIKAQMNLPEKEAEFEGRGYVQSHDVVNTGFIELDRSKVEVQVVYDELAILDENEGVSIKRINRDVETKNPYALNLMRITVDGQPLNDPNKGIPDVQRCTDVALDKAQVHFKFDNLQVKPRLNVTAWPNVISYADSGDTEFVENLTNFKLYTNYPAFIDKAEVRLFDAEQSTRDTPIAVVPLNETGEAQWQVNLDEYSAPRMELKYVLRVYDKQGNFDETKEQTLWIVDKLEADNSKPDAQKEMQVGYGENRLGVNNIPLNGGVVKVYGKDIPKDHQVWFAGHPLPVAESGEFGSEFILPSGLHTVEVAITDEAGDGNVYQRDLELEKSDWFYVGIADLTVARDSTNGPAEQVTGDDQHYNNDFAVDGRLAFYAKGKLENESVLTMSADTREGPVDELFSNFMDKSPEALFRRIDPDYYYPTFGDDSTVEEDAPTSGKFYLKWHKDKNYGLWGNFDITYLDNDLAHVDRGLYGSNFNYETESATTFGEKRFAANLFAAEPGTLATRDEFLGTSGSLYYLQHQDILTGSDRIWIEIRDAVSGVVVSVKNLTYGLDYDIDYIQGRIMLNEPLSATAASGMLVNSSDFGGNDAYLVARYEYTPGFSDLNDIVAGGRMHYWLNDYVKLGTTIEDQEVTGNETSLNAYDVTLRKSAGTWLKLEQSTSQGPVSSSQLSSDGGYMFSESALAPGTDNKAKGQRVDASVSLEDIFDGLNGKITLYNQQLDAGYAAPGLITQTDTSQTGTMLEMPVTDNVNVKLKADSKDQENALQTEAMEVDVDYLLNKNWTLGLGLRNDTRTDNRPAVDVPWTQQEGDRSDVAVRATYDSKENWQTYGYVQDTTSVSGNRDENGRVGIGGDYRTSDRFKVDGEVSAGDLGTAVKLGTDYKMTDATDLYMSYALENERTDNGVKARKGNFATGFKNRYSDSASIYMEERYTHGDVPTGLTHALGFDLVATDRLNIGGNVDVGTLVNNITGAKTDRTGVGFRIGYKFDKLTYAGVLEYRVDETELVDQTEPSVTPDPSFEERNTWLIKNSLKYQLNQDWRLIGKLNHSESDSSLGESYNGDFTETVLGYAYRPVDNDALNALFKYTYFYNMPTMDQVTLSNSAAQYIQKSHILSLDVMYDLTPSWTLGGKYAYRFGQLSLDRENPEFFDSTASLYILRADWHFTHRWDALLEGRLLDVKEAGDTRSGMLLGIYRHFDDNMKLGVGYNFTDFSDDLTDMDYDSQGLFVNVIGKF